MTTGILYTVPGRTNADQEKQVSKEMQGTVGEQRITVILYAWKAGRIIRTDADSDTPGRYKNVTEIIDLETGDIVAGDEFDYDATIEALADFHGAIPIDTALRYQEVLLNKQVAAQIAAKRAEMTEGS